MKKFLITLLSIAGAFALALCLTLAFGAFNAASEQAEGNGPLVAEAATTISGTSATWEYNSSTKKLTIGGTGAMADYTAASQQPWYSYRNACTSIQINAGITKVGNYNFAGFTALTEVSLTFFTSGTNVQYNMVNTIGDYSFSGCTALTSVPFNVSGTISIGGVNKPVYGKLATIGKYAFNGCTGLTTIKIPNTVVTISERAFNGCNKATSLTFTSTSQVATIGTYAFNGCNKLGSLTVPESVTSLAKDAFENCSGATRIYFYASNCTTDATSSSTSPFWGCSGVTGVTFVTTLPRYLTIF